MIAVRLNITDASSIIHLQTNKRAATVTTVDKEFPPRFYPDPEESGKTRRRDWDGPSPLCAMTADHRRLTVDTRQNASVARQ
ncbi:hypothetical protein ROHU_003151 [Labeo rohita]|uniref:Uncharacterized protein n=1 Tax=Labeo rohita TaxID=84645 RepID=A0A498NXL7_LABRO|nr:hypothetical protein ROHU_003151 [Labeo rohita]